MHKQVASSLLALIPMPLLDHLPTNLFPVSPNITKYQPD
jgi:hypothetical protein